MPGGLGPLDLIKETTPGDALAGAGPEPAAPSQAGTQHTRREPAWRKAHLRLAHLI